MRRDARGELLQGAGRSQSLKRGLQLVEFLAAHPDGASIASLSRESGLPRATVTRLVASLADAGVASRSLRGRSWTLGPAILRLSRALPSLSELRDRARPLLHHITEVTQETSMFGVPTGRASALVVETVQGPRLTSARASSDNSPLTTPASGFVRLVLAELPDHELNRVVRSLPFERRTPATIMTPDELLLKIQQIRRQGHVIVVDEYEVGLAGVGVPVRRNGVLIGEFALYLPTSRFDRDMRARALALLREAAGKLAV